MKKQDVKTLITSGIILLVIALYMGSPAEEIDTTVTDQQGSISIEQVEGKTGKKRFDVDYIKAYDGLSL